MLGELDHELLGVAVTEVETGGLEHESFKPDERSRVVFEQLLVRSARRPSTLPFSAHRIIRRQLLCWWQLEIVRGTEDVTRFLQCILDLAGGEQGCSGSILLNR